MNNPNIYDFTTIVIFNARADYPSLVDLVRRGKLNSLVSNKMPLDQINEALQMLRDRKISMRAIVMP